MESILGFFFGADFGLGVIIVLIGMGIYKLFGPVGCYLVALVFFVAMCKECKDYEQEEKERKARQERAFDELRRDRLRYRQSWEEYKRTHPTPEKPVPNL